MRVISNYPALCARKSHVTHCVQLRGTHGVDSIENAFHGSPEIVSIELGVK